jgi:hypothetical protein
MTTTERVLGPLFALLALSASARAADGDFPLDLAAPAPTAAPAPSADRTTETDSNATKSPESPSSVERTFSFVPSPSLPAPGQVAGGYAASYASTEAAARPLAALSSRGGFVSALDAELGLHQRFSLAGAVLLAPPAQGETQGRAAGRIGLRAALVDPEARPFRLTALAGYSRDFSGVSLPFVELTSSLDVDRVRFGGLAHAERAIAADRDAVDFYAAAGVSVKTVDALRLGAEYVGQELEAAWQPDEAEGGIRHFAGLTAAVTPTARLFIVGGPAMGLSRASPRVLGRVALTYLF